MPERVGDRPSPGEGRPEIRRLRAVIDVNDPAQVEEWEREFGAAWRERQEQERHDDRTSG